MERYRVAWPVRTLCQVIQVSPSGFYDWRCRQPSRREKRNQTLKAHIQESFHGSDRTHGSPRVWRDLQDWGHVCSENRVARLMRELGLKARSKRRRQPGDTGVRPEHSIAPNLLERQFVAMAPNQRWVSDFTYIWTAEGWLYLAIVIDLFNREVVGWSLKPRMTADLVTDALTMAWFRRKPAAGLIHHSDRGSQYASGAFQAKLTEYGMRCSMSRKGDCWDTPPTESWFGSFKNERVHGERFETRKAMTSMAFEYIEVFYNRKRLHSTLGYRSPMQFMNDRLNSQAQEKQVA